MPLQKMEHTSCTEDRIQHVLERCLCDLGLDTPDKQLWNAGLCINRWCLEELVKRDPHNFLILLQKILRKTKEVLEQCQYELVVPLSLLFSSTLLKAPYVAPECGVLQKAYLLFHSFLSWPEPCCSASKRLLNIIQQELRAPGSASHHCFSCICVCIRMVLLVSPDEDVPPEVQSVSERLSSTQPSNKDVTITLIRHGFQAVLGNKHELQALHTTLQVTDQHCLALGLFFFLFLLLFSMFPKTTSRSSRQSALRSVESDFSEDTGHEDTEEGQDSQPKARKKPKKKSRSLLGVERFSMLFKNPSSPNVCRRVQSMGYRNDVTKDFQRTGLPLKHSRSLSRQGRLLQASSATLDPLSPQKHMCVRRRPILSCDEGDVVEVPTLVKVVVFGGDKEAGRLSKHPRLTKTCKLQFYFVPTKRRTTGSPGGGHTPAEGQTGSSTKAASAVRACSNDLVLEDSTTDIAQMLGMMDPWYERNVLSLLSLSSDVLCQVRSVAEGDVSEGSGSVERLPLLADLVLYYCRHADQPVLVQLYQAELTLAGGEKRREVFIHSLELGHSAGTRAVKAMGAASKRFGIDEERQAVPLTLNVAYNKVAVSGRSQWTQTEIVCTSINLYKVCRKPEQLCDDSRIESLQLTMTEVLKRQCSKSKKHYNQHISISEVKVDKMQVNGGEVGTTFAVCLDQDEKKFIQSVTRCEVSLCCKPGSSSDWRSYKPLPGQIQPLHPSYCSLLCLPITSFSTS
uniref:Phosphoinositide 3-kinase regulatory subunit 5 n=1 Tax=Lates calcarifer TaxID=8187 RepID=A0A4W6F1P8_LATCA